MTKPNTTRFRRGTAMTEFILALPLLLFVLAAMLFMGWSMVRKQHVVVASRYSVWRAYDGGSPSGAELNRAFLGDRAASVNQMHSGGYQNPLQTWVTEAHNVSTSAGDLAQELLINQFNIGAAEGRTTMVQASFDSSIALWRDYFQRMGQMEFACGREGLEWVSPQVQPWAALQRLYYSRLDTSLQGTPNLSGGSNGLSDLMQNLYNGAWNR